MQKVCLGIFLLALGIFYLPNSNAQELDESVQTIINTHIDSIISEYNSGNDKKLEAAITLYGLKSKFLVNYLTIPLNNVEKIVQFDSTGHFEFIEQQFAKKDSNSENYINWQLIKLNKCTSLKQWEKIKIRPEELNLRQKAAYYFLKGDAELRFNEPEQDYLQYFKKAYDLCDEDEKLSAIAFQCLKDIAHHYFSYNQIDSAIFYYVKHLEEFELIEQGKVLYFADFSPFIRCTEKYAQGILNIGVCYQKTGKQVKAIESFKQAMEEFDNQNMSGGYFWAKREIINAYLDMGDYERSRHWIKEYGDDIQVKYSLESSSSENYYTNILFEHDYYDLTQNATFIDSIYTLVDKNEYRYTPHKNYKWVYYLGQVYERLSIRVLTSLMADSDFASNINYLDSLQSIMVEHEKRDYSNVVAKNRSTNAMKLLFIAWTINSGEHIFELDDLLKNKAEIYNQRRTIDLALKILHYRKQFSLEISLLEENIAEAKASSETNTLWKRYYQLAEAYQGIGEFKKANYYFNQYDSTRKQIQQNSLHDQLAEYDKKFELQSIRNSERELFHENEINKTKKSRLVIVVAGISGLLILLGLLVVNIRRKHKAQGAQQKAEMQLLEKDMEQREKALQNTTMELVKSNTSFQKLIKELDELTTTMKPEAKRKARTILVEYKTQLQDDAWKEFNLQFQNANAAFYDKLKKENEGLTESELRIAAMHVSGLSNKEISAITGQQLSSLHTLKSRLRKKLLVENDDELLQKLKAIQES